MLSCEICKIFQNTHCVEHLQTPASDDGGSDESENDDRVIMKAWKQSLADAVQNRDS